MLFEKLQTEAKKYFQILTNDFDYKYEYNYVKFVYLICPMLKITGEEKQRLLEINDLYTRMNEVLKYIYTGYASNDKLSSKVTTQSNNV